MGEYHDSHRKTDVLRLTDVFEEFRRVCLDNYGFEFSLVLHNTWFGFGCSSQENWNYPWTFDRWWSTFDVWRRTARRSINDHKKGMGKQTGMYGQEIIFRPKSYKEKFMREQKTYFCPKLTKKKGWTEMFLHPPPPPPPPLSPTLRYKILPRVCKLKDKDQKSGTNIFNAKTASHWYVRLCLCVWVCVCLFVCVCDVYLSVYEYSYFKKGCHSQ